ncbi:MAG TPA: 2-C-methyl-D-erythritol 4-phosphate cytidylyltransferase [Acidimicrobiia bacterium]|nr:2-C-methyl-D-erythritol 4-phosphate cytidylyltransferase [Acidimicrobiia bacterium]
MKVWTIVVAAGSGERFGTAKQFVRLLGTPVVDRAVATADSVTDGVVVVVPPGHTWQGPVVSASVEGGSTRAESVRRGLAAVPDDADIVLVHDAARPLAGPETFRQVVQAVDAGADAAVPAVPVADTVKRVADGRVLETVDRRDLVAVQTPQAFRASVLREAHRGDPDATDDAALVEASGGRVVVVPGDPRNLKLTTALDLEVAAALLGGSDR